ncbi:MAG TPA: prohibitin family protein [Anaerolineales bacterium]|nr:prohibitin family protein [Anaerolineales bacterium]
MNVADVLRAVATLSWLLALAAIAIAILRAARGAAGMRGAGGIILGALVLAVVLTTVSAGLVFVQPEERGVVISAIAPKGYREQPLQPGLRWVIPFAETVVIYPISRQTYTMSIAPLEGAVAGDDSVAARTSDGQEVLIDASVIFAIYPDRVIDVHIDWQNRYVDGLVRALSRGIIRDAASQFGVEELVSSQRDAFKDQISTEMASKLQDNGIELIEFVIRNITFSTEYAASVEQKQIAEQQAQQAALVVEQRKQEAEQARQTAQGQADAAVIAAQGRAEARVIEAEAEAEALRLIAEALENNPDLITYQYVLKLAPGIQVMLVPNDNPFLLPLPTLTPGANP